jgi:diguanylate cyclase (GGDEF)-like protein
VGRPRISRWVGVALALTLLALTLAAVIGTSRQARLVSGVADASQQADVYQRANYLAAMEIASLQGVLFEPFFASEAEQRREANRLGTRLRAALRQLGTADGSQASRARSLLRQHRALQPHIRRYLGLAARGEISRAQTVLEKHIEPVGAWIRVVLQEEERAHVADYVIDLDRAEQESGLLQLGTVVTFLLGLLVLAALGWSSRSHRLLVERMAAHDSLTGLPNRAAFQTRIKLALRSAQRNGRQPTVLLLDLDGFKDVNDSLGHHMGDVLLVEVSNRLRECVRGQDTVARLGGDEFAVLLTDAESPIGEATAERIAQALSTPFVVEGVTLDIEASVGIVTAEAGQDVATVLRHADTAMYVAKEHRLGHSRFDPANSQDTAGRITLLGAMRRALDEDQIELHFQPKIAVDTGELIGAEALARWRHPVRGLIGPGEFIGVLEGTSLIHRFTAHALRLALAQARQWLDSGRRIPVAVNVSTRSLLDVSFPDTIAQALLAAGVPGELLCIEITENTVMADPERAIGVLRRIRALGVKTAIDDFGTGYSSMAYLKVLPVDEIKVDRSFVTDMASDHSNHVLVESAVDLGHNLGLTVVAEGVEDDPTLDALQSLGCDIAQGYHFAKPLSAADFTGYLSGAATLDTAAS